MWLTRARPIRKVRLPVRRRLFTSDHAGPSKAALSPVSYGRENGKRAGPDHPQAVEKLGRAGDSQQGAVRSLKTGLYESVADATFGSRRAPGPEFNVPLGTGLVLRNSDVAWTGPRAGHRV